MVSARKANQGRAQGGCAYIDNTAKRPDGIGSEDDVCAAASVLHDGTRDHDDVLGGAGQLLDDKVYHLSQGGIFVLEQLRDAEEEGGGFVGGELFARVDEEGDLGQEDSALSGLDGRDVEEARCGLAGSVSIVLSRGHVKAGKGRNSEARGLTFLEDLGAVDPDQARVGILIFLAVVHVGQWGNKRRRGRQDDEGVKGGFLGDMQPIPKDASRHNSQRCQFELVTAQATLAGTRPTHLHNTLTR